MGAHLDKFECELIDGESLTGIMKHEEDGVEASPDLQDRVESADCEEVLLLLQNNDQWDGSVLVKSADSTVGYPRVFSRYGTGLGQQLMENLKSMWGYVRIHKRQGVAL